MILSLSGPMHTLDQFDTFMAELNGVQERINFTSEISKENCNFLDLTIYKSPTFKNTGLLFTKIYYKPTNTFSFPLDTSYIPSHIQKGIAIGEMTGVIHNTTSPVLCEKYKRRLMTHLKHRGYNKHILKRIWKMKHAHRTIMLSPKKLKSIKERPSPLCIQFTQCTPSIQDILSNCSRSD